MHSEWLTLHLWHWAGSGAVVVGGPLLILSQNAFGHGRWNCHENGTANYNMYGSTCPGLESGMLCMCSAHAWTAKRHEILFTPPQLEPLGFS